MAERGRCGGCGDVYALTGKGVVRSHRTYKAGMEPVTIGGEYAYQRAKVCLGVGLPPIGADEPLVSEELTALRRENASLRTLVTVAQSETRMWKARAASGDRLAKVNRMLLELVASTFDYDDARAEERAARFEAEMAALRDRHDALLAKLG